MAANRPILAMGYKEWDAGEIIKQTNTGTVVPSDNYQKIKHTILNYYDLFKKGNLTTNSSEISNYHRKQLTKKLAELI